MDNIFFFKNWRAADKFILFGSTIILIFSFVFYFFYHYKDINNLVDWQLVQDIENITTHLDGYSEFNLDFNIETENYLIKSHYAPGELGINHYASKMYLLAIGFVLTLALTAITFIRKILYFCIGQTFLIAYLAFLKLDILGVSGDFGFNFLLLFGILFYVGTSALFNIYKTQASVLVRFITFSLITIAFGFVIQYGSHHEHPYIFLTNYGFLVPLILSVLFIFNISYDVLGTLFTVVTYSKSPNPNKNVWNYLGIGSIYLLNITSMFLESRGIISWNILKFNPFFLLILSIIVGFWGQKRRDALRNSIIPFQSSGAFLYIAMTILCLATISYSYASGNMVIVKLFKDFILFSHVAVGLTFFAYSLLNFYPILKENQKAYKVLYKPQVLSYSYVNFVGLAIIGLIIVREHNVMISQLKAGSNNFIADVYKLEGDDILAKAYYTNANENSYADLKSGYNLARYYIEEHKYIEAQAQLKRINLFYPSAFSYLELTQAYSKNGTAFFDLYTIQQALKLYPNNGEVLHNAAVIYEKYNKLDSALICYKKAESKLSSNSKVSRANLLAYLAKNINLENFDKISTSIDEILEGEEFNEFLPFVNNKLVCLNIVGKHPSMKPNYKFFEDSTLNAFSCSYLHNYVVNNLNDTTGNTKKFIKTIEDKYDHLGFEDKLLFLKSLQNYYEGNLLESKNGFDELIKFSTPTLKLYFQNIYGLLLLRSGEFKEAHPYFKKSWEVQRYANFNSAPLNFAVLHSYLYPKDSISTLLKEVGTFKPESKTFTQYLESVVSYTKDSIEFQSDDFKLHYILFNKNCRTDSKKLIATVSTISKLNKKAKGCSYALNIALDKKDTSLANIIWSMIPDREVNDIVINDLNFQYLKLLKLKNLYPELHDRADKLSLNGYQTRYIAYFKAIALVAVGQTDAAKPQFELAIKHTPFDDQVWIDYAEYLHKTNDTEKAYNIITDRYHEQPSTDLLKEYAVLSIRSHLMFYARDAYQDLEKSLSKEEFEIFKRNFDYEVKLINKDETETEDEAI